MKGDMPLAAFRLMGLLPVRTHERPQGAYVPESSKLPRSVVVNGVRYESLTEAARKTHRSRESIRNMIKYGLAKFA